MRPSSVVPLSTSSTSSTSSAAVDGEVLDRVRALVRDRGADPLADPAAVRTAILDVLDDVTATSAGTAFTDVEQWARDLQDSVSGYGPLQRLFDDPDVEEVWWNEPTRVFCARRGRSELTTVVLSETQVRDTVERMLRSSGRRVDVSQPFVDALLPDGSLLHVVIPDVTRRHWAVNVRRHVLPASRLDDLVALGTLTPHAARFLTAAVIAGLNIVVAGGTQAGKTTLLSCLLNAVPAHERVVSCEEVFELRVDRPDWVAMQTRQVGLEGTGEITLRRLVIEALRMRPHRLVVGEVRTAEALDLLVALNSGMPGMASVHANSARDAVTKLCVLPLLAGENVTAAYVVPTVASAVDLVVHATTGADGRRRVREVIGLSGRVEQGVVETSEIFTTRDGDLVRSTGFPPHLDRFAAHGIDVRALLGAA
jgi:pilus assembly protein CpaF